MSDDERLTIFSGLSNTSGSTGDFKAVDKVNQLYQSLSDQHKQELEGGTRKSIVFIVTDGGSDDTVKLQEANKKARESGLIVIGIGVGNDGKCVEDNYHSDNRTQGTGVHCPQPSLLPTTAIHALKPHLEIGDTN
ncbi:MAG TPA: VWA domain-containing protein [Candidatus Absconditabacterales bacterium]|nr:VWA domain-containing protein [Candidatus Absconditabacterales bacterium]